MRVLQVEDDATTASSVERMLRSEGYECHTTDHGEEALRLAAENRYDLILLDIVLPDIDGYEVLKRLRAAADETPIVIQSGLVQDARDEAGLGHDDCLAKPFDKARLKARIEAALDRAGKAAPDTPAGSTAPRQDRRRTPRTRLIKSAQVVYDDHKCIVDCVVLSLSKRGAALQPQDTLNLPDRFELRVKFGDTHDCRVCWSHANKLGVRFTDT